MSIEVKPLTPTFGAEIEGVDLASSSALILMRCSKFFPNMV